MNNLNIDHVIERFADEYAYEVPTSDRYGYRSTARSSRTITGVINFSTLSEMMKAGSGVFYTREPINIGGVLDYHGTRYRIATQSDPLTYEIEEVR